MIKKWKYFINESNKTPSNDEELLNKYIGIESEEIKTWMQDFLDDYSYLDFEVCFINARLICITLHDRDLSTISSVYDICVIPNEILEYLKSRFSHYGFFIKKQSTVNKELVDVIYAPRYISILFTSDMS